MKDHDVTWLYGPLQTDIGKQMNLDSAPAAGELSRTNSFTSKKPILKKRSLSEIMLRRSISSSTLIQQATDALRAQQPASRLHDRPVLGQRAFSDFPRSSYSDTPSTPSANGDTSSKASTTTSGRQTPCSKRHIHFNNKVEQCIAINEEHDHCDYHSAIQEDSDSEEELLTMKPVASKANKNSRETTPRNSFSSDSKTIAMLPSTTLKYRGDTPDPVKQAERQRTGPWRSASKISSSSSQETIRPSPAYDNFLLDEEDSDLDTDWDPSTGRRNSIYLHHRQLSSHNSQNGDDVTRTKGLRRTPSGMFMPYEDEEGVAANGLLGKVVDTVSTARDIAHVIWNVGWRR